MDCHNTLQIQHIQAEVLIALSEKVIINLKIDINPKCNPGMTPLHHAAEYLLGSSWVDFFLNFKGYSKAVLTMQALDIFLPQIRILGHIN